MDKQSERLGSLMAFSDLGLIISTYGVLLAYNFLIEPISTNTWIVCSFFVGIKILVLGIADITGIGRSIFVSIIFIIIADAVVLLINQLMAFGLSFRMLAIMVGVDVVMTIISVLIWKSFAKNNYESRTGDENRDWVYSDIEAEPINNRQDDLDLNNTNLQNLINENKPTELPQQDFIFADISDRNDLNQEENVFTFEEFSGQNEPINQEQATQTQTNLFDLESTLNNKVEPEEETDEVFASEEEPEVEEVQEEASSLEPVVEVAETTPVEETKVVEDIAEVQPENEVAEEKETEVEPTTVIALGTEESVETEEKPVETEEPEEPSETKEETAEPETEEKVEEKPEEESKVTETPTEETKVVEKPVEEKTEKKEVQAENEKPEKETLGVIEEADYKELTGVLPKLGSKFEPISVDVRQKELDADRTQIKEEAIRLNDNLNKLIRIYNESAQSEEKGNKIENMEEITLDTRISTSDRIIRNKLKEIIDRQYVSSNVLHDLIDVTNLISNRAYSIDVAENNLKAKEEAERKRQAEAKRQEQLKIQQQQAKLHEQQQKTLKADNEEKVHYQNNDMDIIIDKADLELLKEFLKQQDANK